MQTIVMGTGNLYEATVEKKKNITIRKGYRNIKLEPILITYGDENCERDVYKIIHTKLSEVSNEDLYDDGFSDVEHALSVLKNFYPDINLDSEVTVIRWR